MSVQTACGSRFALAVLVTLSVVAGSAQSPVNTSPSRVLGQTTLTPLGSSPNLVEGRELWFPWSVAVDRSSSPNPIYVSDSGNNRVLAWNNATSFANGAPADLVIGQFDRTSTNGLGPGTPRSTGLNSPGVLAVDSKGNLYVVDAGNNRILRFPKPFAATDEPRSPDMVIGQSDFSSSRLANAGGISARSIATLSGNNYTRGGLAFDRQGNLYFSDSLNHRVLRYSVDALNSGVNEPAANLVLGQPNFTSVTVPPSNATSRGNRAILRLPAGLAVDGDGRLYVGDELSRVLVFSPPYGNGATAGRLVGANPAGSNTSVTPYAIASATGVFLTPAGLLGVVDPSLNRILVYPPFSEWPAETPQIPSPAANVVIGQPSFQSSRANQGRNGATSFTLSQPVGAFVSNTELFVADYGNNRVLAFPQIATAAGASRVLGQTGLEFSGANLVEGREFYLVSTTVTGGGLAVDRSGTQPYLYVADTFNHRVLGFRSARSFQNGAAADLVIGQESLAQVQVNSPSNDADTPTVEGLDQPIGLAVDSNGDLFVADSGNGRILRFPAPFANTGRRQRANLVLGQANFSVYSNGASQTTMNRPYGIALTADRSVVVTDAAHNRALVFRRPSGGDFALGQNAERVLGQADFATTTAGNGPNQMRAPGHVSVDGSDRIYLFDSGNSRIQVFQLPSQIANQPTPAFTSASVNGVGVYANPVTSEIWVANRNGNRLLRYPSYEQFALGGRFDTEVGSFSPLAVTQDEKGNLLAAETINRVALYYNGISSQIAGNYADRPLAPATIAIAYPRRGGLDFGPETLSFDQLENPIPMPRELADLKVMVGGQAAPLYFVSPRQINYLVPMDTPGAGITEVQVVRASTGEVLAMSPVEIAQVAPALFAQNGAEQGQLAALNEDSTVNSGLNPIQRGQVIQMFGTGQGMVPGAPADGTPAEGAVSTPEMPVVVIGGRILPQSDVLYSGLAPSLVGVWQVNARVPAEGLSGTQVEVAITLRSVPTNRGAGNKVLRTTIAVRP